MVGSSFLKGGGVTWHEKPNEKRKRKKEKSRLTYASRLITIGRPVKLPVMRRDKTRMIACPPHNGHAMA